MTISSSHKWTYGAEHEWADWPLDRELPKGYGIDRRDKTIVNSNGIANDPKGRLYRLGGEINTPPTDTIKGQVRCLNVLRNLLPEARVNYRSNLHIHVRVPGLKDDLVMLKQLQRYTHNNMRRALAQIQPLPRPVHNALSYTQEEYEGELRRWRRRCVSHQTLLTETRLKYQLAAPTIEEFFKREVPRAGNDGRPMWHFQPRLCVNIRQLLETDTIEFRHFAGTLDEEKMLTCVEWCHEYLRFAFAGRRIEELLRAPWFATERFPAFPPYVHWMEERYRRTVHDGTLSKLQIAANIRQILKEDGCD